MIRAPMASDRGKDPVRDLARGCLHRFKTSEERLALEELFRRAGCQEALSRENSSISVKERFRRRRQRRKKAWEAKMSGLEEVVCPITMSRPTEPVLLADGNIYEKRAIDCWLSKNATSPLTRERLHQRPYVPWSRVEEAVSRRHSSGAA